LSPDHHRDEQQKAANYQAQLRNQRAGLGGIAGVGELGAAYLTGGASAGAPTDPESRAARRSKTRFTGDVSPTADAPSAAE